MKFTVTAPFDADSYETDLIAAEEKAIGEAMHRALSERPKAGRTHPTPNGNPEGPVLDRSEKAAT